MAEYKIQPWQREVSRINLKEGERAFVYPDGRVIASNTKDPGFVEHQKTRQAEKGKKLRERISERMGKRSSCSS